MNKTEYLNNKIFENLIYKFQQSKKNKNKYTFILEDLKNYIDIRKKNKFNITEHKEIFNEIKKELNLALIEHDDSKQKLSIAFYTLSENIVRYAKFNLIDCEDAVQEGVLICFEKIDRFNPKKGKAFNYMTTCILNHYRQLYRTAKNYNELKKRYQLFLESRVTEVLIKNGQKIIKG